MHSLKSLSILTTAGVLTLAASTASAALLPVVNGDIESPDVAAWTQIPAGGSIPGWLNVDDGFGAGTSTYQTEGWFDSQKIYLSNGYLQQDLVGLGEPDTTYTFTAEIVGNSATAFIMSIVVGAETYSETLVAPTLDVIETQSISFTTSGAVVSGSDIRIQLDSKTNGGAIGFDKVTLDAEAVPEPVSLAVAALGLPLLARRRRAVQA